MANRPWGYDELMVSAAVSYCLGRRTYITQICADWLIEQWPNFSERTRELIRRDIDTAFERDDIARGHREAYPLESCPQLHLGDDCDRTEWERVRKLWFKETQDA